MTHIFSHPLRCEHTTSYAGKRFRECEHRDVHPVGQTEHRSRTSPAFAQYAETVRIVHHNAGVVLIGKVAYLRQFAYIPPHREHTIRHNQLACLQRKRLQFAL